MYLRNHQWSSHVDSSNGNPKYRRNRIRHELMPVLKQLNPKIVQTLVRQGTILREESEYLDHVASQALASVMLKTSDDRVIVSQSALAGLPRSIQRRVVRLLYWQVTGTAVYPRFDCVESILNLVNREISGVIMQCQGMRVYRDYKDIHLCAVRVATSLCEPSWTTTILPLSVPGAVCWPLTGETLEALMVKTLPKAWKNVPLCVYLDGDQFTHDLVVRQWQAGDTFYPYGMGGKRKKLQDFFSDLKVSRRSRPAIPIVVAPEGILWVAGFRTDHRFRVMSETTNVVALMIRSEFTAPIFTKRHTVRHTV